MTTPFGNPDWQGFANAQSQNLFPSFTVSGASGTVTGTIFPVVNWSSLTMRFTPTAGAAILFINSFADAAGAQQVGLDVFRVNNSVGIQMTMPCRARYMRIDYQVTSAGTLSATTYAALCSAFSPTFHFPTDSLSLGAANQTLVASASATITPSLLITGQAYLMFNPADATGKLQVTLNQLDELGALVRILYESIAPTTTIYQLLMLPARPLSLVVKNNDGAAPHSYDIAMTCVPA